MNVILDNVYGGKKVVITGHTGFKGSWLSAWLNSLGADVLGCSLPPDTSPSHFELLNLSTKNQFVDIRNYKELDEIFSNFQPEIVFHMAAQPLVRKSYIAPRETYETNVIGTLNVYEACKNAKSVRAIVSITTDKVYDNKEWEWGYRENDNLGGHDPYSSSKACAEILSDSYRKSFLLSDHGKNQVLLATVRAGNVIGGGDWSSDRLIPDAVKAANDKKITLVRNPLSVRPWQHVLEPLYAYMLVGKRLLEGESEIATAWNIGPVNEAEWTVKEVMSQCRSFWPKINWNTPEFQEGISPHEAKNLKLDCSQAISKLDWFPIWDTKSALEKTISWYRDYYEEGQVNTLRDIDSFSMQIDNINSPPDLKLLANS